LNHLKEAGVEEAGEEIPTGVLPEEDQDVLFKLGETFEKAMNDDFNTAAALGHIFDGVRRINRISPEETGKDESSAVAFVTLGNEVVRLAGALGLLSDSGESYFRYAIEGSLKGRGVELDSILDKVREREEARRMKDFPKADAIRDDLGRWGIILEDTRYGTFWKFKEEDANR
jgi:cysteinyl-tRNA synthetase